MPPSPQEHAFSIALITVLALLCLALSVGIGEPATVYVATTGNDARTCAQAKTQATPRRSVQQGIACLAAGDTLLLGDGTYHEQISDVASDEMPGTIRPPAGLSWSQPTTIKAANARKAMLDKPAPGNPYNMAVYLGRADTRYISIEGLVIDGRGHGTCMWVGPSSNIRLKGNLIRNCGSHGIYGAVADDGSGGTDIQLLDNEVVNVATEQGGQPPGSHSIYFTGNHSVARNNYIHGCPYYGLHYTSEHGGVHTNVIENNRIVGCDQAGIYSQGHTTTIRNNLLENNCIGIYLASGATLVANNTLYGTHTAPLCGDSYGILDRSGGSTLVNNVILQQHQYVYAMNVPPQMATNLCDAPGCQLQVAEHSAVIVDGPGGNLTLKAGGPAVNTGTPVAQVPTDRLGVIRAQGSAYDIGAYEYTTSAPPVPGAGADTTPPQVAVTSPAAGAQLTGVVTLTAEATDAVGVQGVQFKLDGTNLGPEQAAAPWQHVWDTASSTPGVHTIAASARDSAGNFNTSVSIIVTVVTSTSPPDRPARPLPPASGAVSCVGALGAEGKITMECQPVTQKR